jgi:hypothetical protein
VASLKNGKKKRRIGGLYSVEVVQRRIPINRKSFLAFRISANMILLNDFTVKAAFQRLFKRKRGMNLIWRVSFKNPMAIRTFEGKLRLNHDTPST